MLFEKVDSAVIGWPAPGAPPARADAAAQLATFVDATDIPLVTTPQTRGVVPEDHPLALVASRNRAQREADVVVAVGTRANWLNGHLRPPRFGADARFVVANIDAGEIGRGRVPEVGVVADAGVFLDQLTDRMTAAGGIRAAACAWSDSLVANDLAKETGAWASRCPSRWAPRSPGPTGRSSS